MKKVQDDLENKQSFRGWIFEKKKEGGANESGALGGVYKSLDGQLALIKQEKDLANNISEFLGSQIFSIISPGYGAEVSLTVSSDLEKQLESDQGLQDDGSRVYVRSKYLKNYSDDLYKDMDKYMSKKSRPGGG